MGKFFTGFNNTFDRASVGYMKFTNVVARKIKEALSLSWSSVGVYLLVGKFIPGGFIPEEDHGLFLCQHTVAGCGLYSAE